MLGEETHRAKVKIYSTIWELGGKMARKAGEVGRGLIVDNSLFQTEKQIFHLECCGAILRGFPENE